MNVKKTYIIIFFIALLFTLTLSLVYTLKTMPEINFKNKCPIANSNQLQLCEENPDFVSYGEISKHLINAVLVAEDISFFQHNGFDFYEIKESFFTNLRRLKLARGGSTITQQMVKNVYLTKDKTFRRKIHEAILTLSVEDNFSKEKILEFYFNAIEFGPNIYGINNAIMYYFNKAPNEINVLEAAFIAYLLPNPKLYSQSFLKEELSDFAQQRLMDIIEKLYFYKKISESQKNTAIRLMPMFPWKSISDNDQMLLTVLF